jgi:hypothetical protein
MEEPKNPHQGNLLATIFIIGVGIAMVCLIVFITKPSKKETLKPVIVKGF